MATGGLGYRYVGRVDRRVRRRCYRISLLAFIVEHNKYALWKILSKCVQHLKGSVIHVNSVWTAKAHQKGRYL
ncbi:hypothetical protein Y032_0200g1694 [Ancylostoma ceylanicum]|uniref:Uncharacterized protein n=1 Tax=Ancylostoma ceylanicum TaxID=53326 RepID=A0A016SNL1_9BILA|nr:hypothetical protein Y032_0200g1694 [Ancylostoma ceylanicum]